MRAFILAVVLAGPLEGEEQVLFDFKSESDLKAWKELEPAGSGRREPPLSLELANGNASPEGKGLKITFGGGEWPSAGTSRVPEDWSAFQSLKAEITVGRTCVVGLTVMQEKSTRDHSWEGAISRWTTTQFLKAGTNRVKASLLDPSRNGYGINKAKYGKVTSLEIFMYRPHPGESIRVGALRVSSANEADPPKGKIEFHVAGTDWTVSSVGELGKKLKENWKPPVAKTIDQVEAEFRAEYEEIKKARPRSVLAVLRDGQPGLDGRLYTGWKDDHLELHGPDANTLSRAQNSGRSPTNEAFMRHRSLLLQVDLSAIPKGASILAARFILVRAGSWKSTDSHHPEKPNMWVAEVCNRPWEEYEVNAYEYARDKFWDSVGGMNSYGNPDPDFLPMYLAFGPSQGIVNVWDFKEAVKYWTGGVHPNHGFMLHGDAGDYMMAYCREAPEVKNRPALLVVFENQK